MSRKITKTFTGGDFTAYDAATGWCREHGISCGSMSSPFPTGLMWGKVLIAKWKNLTAKERAQVHGTISAGSFREGPVTLSIIPKP